MDLRQEEPNGQLLPTLTGSPTSTLTKFFLIFPDVEHTMTALVATSSTRNFALGSDSFTMPSTCAIVT